MATKTDHKEASQTIEHWLTDQITLKTNVRSNGELLLSTPETANVAITVGFSELLRTCVKVTTIDSNFIIKLAFDCYFLFALITLNYFLGLKDCIYRLLPDITYKQTS